MDQIHGFSKLNKSEKIDWLARQFKGKNATDILDFQNYWHQDQKVQKIIDDFSENTVSNFLIPFSLAPNFLINGQLKTLPMAIEESSVVAAACGAAKYWLTRGGFKSTVRSTLKKGHVHFLFSGKFSELSEAFIKAKPQLLANLYPIEENMRARGGGVHSLELKDCTHQMENYYTLELSAETCDAMGANFINTLLETLAHDFKILDTRIEIVMAILSNYTTECIVEAEVRCSIDQLSDINIGMSAADFAKKFKQAVDIAIVNTDRAVTHNKGIFNGVDALVIATGNDFRAVEAAGHAYACRSGQYRSLSTCEIVDQEFIFRLELPMALGTVGGLTQLHPLASKALQILGAPSASELMQMCCTLGLAQNFAAIRSLVTTGIQKGHMKMHLLNILNQLGASEKEGQAVKQYFNNRKISFAEVESYLTSMRSIQ